MLLLRLFAIINAVFCCFIHGICGLMEQNNNVELAAISAAGDCAQLQRSHPSLSPGVYQIHDWTCPNPSDCPLPVRCDPEFEGGGWTVILNRFDGSLDFNRNWNEYRNGFGSIRGNAEFWLGNQHLHIISSRPNCLNELAIRMWTAGERKQVIARYTHFLVANEILKYCLSLGQLLIAPNLSVIDDLAGARDQLFVTPDRGSGGCGTPLDFGWWLEERDCRRPANGTMTVPYLATEHSAGIRWAGERMVAVQLLIRPVGFVAPAIDTPYLRDLP